VVTYSNKVKSCVYTSAEKSTEFQLMTLVRVPLYSQTETRLNYIEMEAYILKVKSDSPTH